jgi:ECF sigma factor
VTAVDSAEITRLLKAWDSGDKAALERLIPKVYDELRRMARRYMKKERAGHTLQTTALINEVYLRLVDCALFRVQRSGPGAISPNRPAFHLYSASR